MIDRAVAALGLLLLAAAGSSAQEVVDVERAFSAVRPALESKATHMAEGSQYYFEGTANAEERQALKEALRTTQTMSVQVVEGAGVRVTYDAEQNRIVVPKGVLEALRQRVKGLSEARRVVAVHDALTGLIANEGVKALYHGPKMRYATRATDVLYRASPGARYAMLDQSPSEDPLRFMETVVKQGPLPKASGLSALEGVSKPMVRNLRTVEAGLRSYYGLSLEVSQSATTPVEVDAERMRIKVSQAALAAIEAKAKASSNPEQYRRAALTALLDKTGGQVRGWGGGTNWEQLYLRGTVKRLQRGEIASVPMGSIANYWGGVTDALDRGLRWAYDMPGEGVRLNGLVVEESRLAEIGFDSKQNRVRVTTGMLAVIQEEARRSAFPREFAQQTLGEMANRIASRASGVGDTYAREIYDKGRELQLKEGARTVVAKSEFSERVASLVRSDLAKEVSAAVEPLRANAEKLPYLPQTGMYEDLENPKKRYATRAEFETEYLAKLRAEYRLPSGRLDWKRLGRDKTLREGGALGHFALALFLKELAVVVRTGDRGRIEDFFDGLQEIGFYKHYGLFALGARAGEVAYARFLQRHIKPVFVSGILRTNIALATGLALPQLVDGNFNGKGFAISLGSLGLSSTAVRAGVASIKWVKNLRSAKATASTGAAVSRLARAGGWFYTAAELAVVLYLAEDIEQRVNAWADRKAALDAMEEAGAAFLAATRDPNANAASLEEAAKIYREAGTAYRDFLYQPLLAAEAEFAGRLAKIARKAKLADDRTQTALKRIADHPALKARIEARGETLESYAKVLSAKGDEEVKRELAEAMQRYQRGREAQLKSIYGAGRREGKLLDGVKNLDWIAAGAQAGATGDPYAGRSAVLARKGRESTIREFHGDVRDRLSGNRLQSYEDEVEVLVMAAKGRRARGDTAGAEGIERVLNLSRRTAGRDRELFAGGSFGGAADRLKGLQRR
ncbi:MAG: hypothetical protein JKY65_16355 [Planctomycetes bacterium]|nr:hypothetical protein [Planctomycetota bacterium]